MIERIMGLLIVLCVMAIAVIILKYKKDKIRWKQEVDDNFRRGKEEATDVIRMTIDKVQDDKSKLVTMSEKDLMIETMLALGGYGRRIDRIEEKMQVIINYKVCIEEMNKQFSNLSNGYVILQNNIKDTESFVNTFKTRVQETTNSINMLNNGLSEVGNIKQKVDKLVENLNKTVYMLESMNSQVVTITKNMNDVFDTYGDAPMVKLKKIDVTMSEMKSTVDNLYNTINAFEENMSDVKSTVDYALDQQSWDSIYDRIEKLQAGLDSIKERVDNSLDQFSFSSVYSKIEELGNRIHN